MANGADIIIKGSSVDIEYDDVVYPPESGKPRNHKSRDKRIARVTVADGSGAARYDSDKEGADPSAWTITVYCS